MQNTITTLSAKKGKGEKVTMITAYDYTMAKLCSAAGVDMILVGDSLGMVMLGYEDTISVTMEDMIHHTAAVSRGCGDSFVVADMPFMSYQVSVPTALKNAGRLMKEGRARTVKLEGGKEICDRIQLMVQSGIPVVGHLGLTPQSVNTMGGYHVQGKNIATAQKLLDDARAVQEAGAFAIVLECVPALLAKKITEELDCLTIGIGAGVYCDGQVLVGQDALSMFSDFRPKFVKHFAEAGQYIKDGIASYCNEVRSQSFPSKEYSFAMDETIIDKLS